MKSRALAVLATLSLIATPVAVQAAKPGEIELHIEATAQVPPDHAVVPITITASGKTEAAARAELRKEEDQLMAALSANGIDAARVKTEGAVAGNDAITIRNAEEQAACATTAIAVEAPSKGKAAHRAVDRSNCDIPIYQTASKTLLISFDDPSKVEQVQSLGTAEGNPYNRLRPIFTQSDPVAARKKARAEALAKANSEADAYADAMGYRVVRIVRVSNARPAMNMNDLIGFVAKLEDRVKRLEPSWFGATVTETVAIDYLIVPK
jgi:uncharacterized protein YggE